MVITAMIRPRLIQPFESPAAHLSSEGLELGLDKVLGDDFIDQYRFVEDLPCCKRVHRIWDRVRWEAEQKLFTDTKTIDREKTRTAPVGLPLNSLGIRRIRYHCMQLRGKVWRTLLCKRKLEEAPMVLRIIVICVIRFARGCELTGWSFWCWDHGWWLRLWSRGVMNGEPAWRSWWGMKLLQWLIGAILLWDLIIVGSGSWHCWRCKKVDNSILRTSFFTSLIDRSEIDLP